ncbi:MAG: ABC transporter permease subunit, partial [Planctomycetota bacterium]|nr:ABC transporter permease subunit [Planctomycetota bacterium]
YLSCVNPSIALFSVIDPPPFVGPEFFWICCGELVGLGLLALWLTVRRVRKLRSREDRAGTQAHPSEGTRHKEQGKRSWEQQFLIGKIAAGNALAVDTGDVAATANDAATDAEPPQGAASDGAAYASVMSQGPVWNNPVTWREISYLRARKGRRVVRWLVVMYLLILFFPVCVMPRGGDTTEAFLAISFGLSVTVGAGLLWLTTANLAAASIVREKEDQTLDLVLVTPMGRLMLLVGKTRGVISATRPMWIAVACTFVLGLLSVEARALVFGAGLLLTVVHFWFLSLCLGLICSCLFSGVARASTAVMCILVGLCAIFPLLAALIPYHYHYGTDLRQILVMVSPYAHIATLLELVWRSRWGGMRGSGHFVPLFVYFLATTILALLWLWHAAKRLTGARAGRREAA